jgi:hypothetical protein
VVADHVGAITAPCAQDGRDPCALLQGGMVTKEAQ